MDSISSDEARRIALAAQGFGLPRPRRPGADDMRRTIDRLRLIQIDSVNVLVRAHYMPFFSRLGPYRREMLDELAYRDRYVFEQWAHEACFIPLADYSLLRHRMDRGRRWHSRHLTAERQAYFASVLEKVREEGPAQAGELEGKRGSKGWWEWSHAKVALEYQFAHGRLAVKERRNFARIYDVADRVFDPQVLETPGHAEADAHREMVGQSLAALGVATAHDVADYYRLKTAEVKPRIAELVSAGMARPVRVEGWKDEAYLAPGVAAAPNLSASALLSPFDNLVWDRARTERLFGFRYRIEIYTPEPKRVYGYYVLPFMNDNHLAARVDLKADRKTRTLLVPAAHLEPGAPAGKTATALARELRAMARWLGLERIAAGERGNLSARLMRHFAH
ncbi:crosslink repair DNA glycosylase YcaQ family protein [Candidatus Amarobacter glycogenicus]|uniref:winged helix-turn-helix domain-containing protein n=1 Tax=Candidatus Amarobacter glycogenicus TaxID=3140699 RepID=UPI00313765CE|nr:YcaQ family DNA glycosylase [Dehalococcoidia bacterium]MCC6269021.1 YcaQ family DNA glycosylase [Dehalococcoidia bacterium]